MNPETLTQSPVVSTATLEKKSAIQTAADTIFSRIGENPTSEQALAAATLYLEEVRALGNYRLEQAAAKLEEYYRFEVQTDRELAMRRKELDDVLPGIGERLRAANDERFNNSANDEKYKVAS